MKDIVYSLMKVRGCIINFIFWIFLMANKGHIPWNKGLKTNKPAYNSLNIDKDLLYDLYINQKLSSTEVANKFNCTSKTIRNWLVKYGIPVRQMGEAVKLERSKWSEDKELKRSIKYHNTWVKKPEEEKKEAQLKRLASPNVNSPQSILKANLTRIANGTINKSKSEDDFYNKLQLLGFNKDDIIRYYIDDRYPFNCDFYIKSKDLFIEYQGHQTHGDEPFDINNPKHLEIVNKAQEKHFDMSTWFKRDPLKLKTAIENKINLILVYPKHKTYLVTEGNITTIDINDINKI